MACKREVRRMIDTTNAADLPDGLALSRSNELRRAVSSSRHRLIRVTRSHPPELDSSRQRDPSTDRKGQT
jgi:hypothetical protein